ncbi:general stress protein [Nonomuraea sp. NPDC050783]|uniref:general stress protein n=1 Tax=Nonomuraea sp. NPDC050783 TaxID=3154634 RepID=UPI0034656154
MATTAPTLVLPDAADRPVVGSYSTAEQAREAVGFLADNGFPVERAGIVGSDLRLVETVLGRATALRAAGAGAATGVWFGMPAGLLMPIVTGDPGVALAAALGGLVYGALFGAAFGLVSHLLARGRHGIVSRHDIVAGRYDVVTDVAVADDARNLLVTYGWRTT